jgi:hypothetical protein
VKLWHPAAAFPAYQNAAERKFLPPEKRRNITFVLNADLQLMSAFQSRFRGNVRAGKTR